MYRLLALTIGTASVMAGSLAATPAARADSTWVTPKHSSFASSSRLAFLETAVRILRSRLAATHLHQVPAPVAARAHLQRVMRDSLRLLSHRGTPHPSLEQARLELRRLANRLEGIADGRPDSSVRLASLASAVGDWLRAFRGLANAG